MIQTVWVKSSHSNGLGGECLEFSRDFAATAGVVPVRDSKCPDRPALVLPVASWQAFVRAAQ